MFQIQESLLSDSNIVCEEEISDVYGWVAEHCENSSVFLEKTGLLDELINKYVLSFAAQID